MEYAQDGLCHQAFRSYSESHKNLAHQLPKNKAEKNRDTIQARNEQEQIFPCSRYHQHHPQTTLQQCAQNSERSNQTQLRQAYKSEQRA